MAKPQRPDDVPGVRAKNGGWEVRVYIGTDPRTGRQRHRSRFIPAGGLSKAAQIRAVEDARRELLNKRDEEKPAATGTVDKLLDDWWKKVEPDLSPSTAAAYESYLRLHIRPELGRVKLAQVDAALLDSVYATLRRKLAPASVAKVHTILHSAFAQAVRWKWLPYNPADAATKPKVTRPPIEPPEPVDVAKLLKVAESDPQFFAYLMVATDTGRRRSQVLGLRWPHLDLENGTATFGRAIVLGRRKGGGTFVTERGDKADTRMTVALRPATVAALKAWREGAELRAKRATTKVAKDGFVFSYDPASVKPWRPDGVTSRFATVRTKAGLEHVRLHDLRHWAVTVLLGAGVDVGTVADRVGHRNANVTLNVYRHFLPAADRKAADVIEGLLG